MPSILELLKRQQPGAAAPVQGVSQTAQMQALSQAKSGKALPQGAAPVSNIGEQMANQQTKSQLDALNTQTTMEQAGQTQQAAGMATDQTNKLAGLQQDEAQKRDELKLDQTKHDAMQQVFKKGLASEKIKQQIQMKAEQQGWEDQIAFEEDLQSDIFGQERSNLFASLGYKNALNADQREWEDIMTRLSGGDWYEAAMNEMEAAMQKQKMEGMGKAGTSVAGYGAQKGAFDSKGESTDNATGTRERGTSANSGTTQGHGGSNYKSGY